MSATQQVQDATARRIAEHNTGIGGSQVHHVFSLAPHGCARSLVYQKRDIQPDHPFHGNNATERGLKLEDFAADIYAEQTGRTIRRVPGSLQGVARRDRVFPFILCRSDREIVNDQRGPGVLSIKVLGRESFQKIKYEGLSPAYTLQLQEELGVWDRTWGSFAIFWADGWELLWFDVERDAELVEQIYTGIRNVWEVIQDLEASLPDRLDAKDPRCGRCPFRTTCQGQALLKLMGKGEEGIEIPYDPSLAELIQLRNEHADIADQASALLEETNAKIKAAMGDRQVCETDGARIYYRVQKGRRTIQADPLGKALAKLGGDQADELRQLVASCTNIGEPFRALKVYAK